MSFNFSEIPNLGDVIAVHGRISRKNLHFVNSTLDTHEGLGLMRTVDRHEGRIMFWIAPDLWNDFVAFAEDMHARAGLEINEVLNPDLIPARGRRTVNEKSIDAPPTDSSPHTSDSAPS